MLELALRVHARTLLWLEQLVADMSDEELARPMAPGHHSGLWVLGHLSFALDRARLRLGEPVVTPDDRMKAFGPGSEAGAAVPTGLTKELLLRELREKHALVEIAVAQADRAALELPHGNPFHEGTPLRTMGDSVANLLTAHAGYHTGQLSVYRRALGRAPLF